MYVRSSPAFLLARVDAAERQFKIISSLRFAFLLLFSCPISFQTYRSRQWTQTGKQTGLVIDCAHGRRVRRFEFYSLWFQSFWPVCDRRAVGARWAVSLARRKLLQCERSEANAHECQKPGWIPPRASDCNLCFMINTFNTIISHKKQDSKGLTRLNLLEAIGMFTWAL